MLQLCPSNSRNKMQIKTVTWLKDSHALFDYQLTKTIAKEQFEVSLEPCFVFFYRNNQNSQIMITKESKMIPKGIQGTQLLGSFRILVEKNKKYKIQFHQASLFESTNEKKVQNLATEVSNQSQEQKNEGMYFVIRSLKDSENEPKGFELKSGQTIKFGRIQFNLTVVKETDSNKNRNFFEYEETYVVNEEIKYTEQDACKICFTGEDLQREGYFLCSPCFCTGSCSAIHFECLHLWCKTKVKKSRQGLISHYNFEKFNCEICKKYFPRFIQKQGKKYDLLPIEKPTCSYLALTSHKMQEMQKNLIIIKYTNSGKLKVGRNQSCDIRIIDVSVSRQHAMIQMRNGDFYLYDNKSKFGTVVGIPKFQMELQNVKRGIQIGRTVITFQLAGK